jgi:hypothetical protein
MPPSSASDDQFWAILAYLRTLAAGVPVAVSTSGDAANGEKIFWSLCGSCHRVNGRGGYLGPDLSHIGSRRTHEALVGAIRNAGRSIVPGYQPVPLVTADGRRIRGDFSAFDAVSGKPLWHCPTGASIWGAAAMTYMLDGRQYVLIASGSTLVAFALPPQ